MLRALVLLLLLANAALFAWGMGFFSPLLTAPGAQREPDRLSAELNPNNIVLVKAASAPATPAAPERICLTSSGNPAELAPKLTAALNDAGLNTPTAAKEAVEGALWMVYIGKLTAEGALKKKLAELKSFGVSDYAEIKDAAAWQPGISLGVYKDAARAETRLTELGAQGVRSARVVERANGVKVVAIELPAVLASEREKWDAALLAAGGKALAPCPKVK